MLNNVIKVRVITMLWMFVFSMQTVCAQLYMPRDIKKAYEKNTRSLDGTPGKNYWQNSADYYIKIAMQPPARKVIGEETIVYYNRSNDTITSVFVKLYMNAHMPGIIRYEDVDEGYLTSGMHIDSFLINNKKVPWQQFPFHYTMQLVNLPAALLPHESMKMSFKWHYDVSLTSRREGMIDSTTWFLAYFYPRIAVYDDYNGWDKSDFTGQQEFYSDFNNYALKVTVPEKFNVWATGDLINAKAVLPPEQYRLREQAKQVDTVVHIVSSMNTGRKKGRQPERSLTWQWQANGVSDIALAISDHFSWDASSVLVDSIAGKRTFVQSVYNDTSEAFKSLTVASKYAIRWYSSQIPGVPFPYPSMTVFQGYANMEYPMIVNIEANGGEYYVRYLADHEIAHTYFPFLIGTNESRYAFMDEGWATFLELLIGRSYKTIEAADNLFKDFRVNLWINDNSPDEDLPVITPSGVLRDASYFNNSYGKPALAYLALQKVLGDKLFLKCLHGFIERWRGKHPLPWDFFYSFNDLSGKNLDWFWNNWFFSNHYIDLSLESISTTDDGYAIKVINNGGFAIPFICRLLYEDGSMEEKPLSPSIWEHTPKNYGVLVKTSKKLRAVVIENGVFVDATTSNNKLALKQ